MRHLRMRLGTINCKHLQAAGLIQCKNADLIANFARPVTKVVNLLKVPLHTYFEVMGFDTRHDRHSESSSAGHAVKLRKGSQGG